MLKVFDDFSHRLTGSFRTQKTPNNEDTDILEGWEEVRAGKMLWELLDFAPLLAPLLVYGLVRADTQGPSSSVCMFLCVLVLHMDVCGGQRSILVAVPQDRSSFISVAVIKLRDEEGFSEF